MPGYGVRYYGSEVSPITPSSRGRRTRRDPSELAASPDVWIWHVHSEGEVLPTALALNGRGVAHSARPRRRRRTSAGMAASPDTELRRAFPEAQRRLMPAYRAHPQEARRRPISGIGACSPGIGTRAPWARRLPMPGHYARAIGEYGPIPGNDLRL